MGNQKKVKINLPIFISICPVSACKHFLTAQCDLVVPMYLKKSLKFFFFEFEEDLGMAKMAQFLKKCFLGQEIVIFEGFSPPLNITFSHFFFFLHTHHDLYFQGKLLGKPKYYCWYPEI